MSGGSRIEDRSSTGIRGVTTKMKLSTHIVREGARIVLYWVLMAFLLLAATAPGDVLARYPILVPVLIGVIGVATGVLSALFELVWLPRFVRRLTSAQALAFWTATYVAIALGVTALAVVLGTSLAVRLPGGVSIAAPAFSDLFATEFFWRPVIGLVALSFLVNLGRQVRLVLGPGTMLALLLGRYRRPVAEERVFMFVDLTGSTGLAQRLGPARLNDFKNDFFADVAQAVLETRGRIYQYVGDEVVVTWSVGKGRARGRAIAAFLRIEAIVRASAERYARRYGAVPSFKAGIHAGPVVTAEVGYLKKDIVHSGDTVNVAARIEAACHAYEARLLVSEAALAVLDVPEGAAAEDVGEAALRGRDGKIRLFRLVRAAPV